MRERHVRDWIVPGHIPDTLLSSASVSLASFVAKSRGKEKRPRISTKFGRGIEAGQVDAKVERGIKTHGNTPRWPVSVQIG